MKKLISVNEYIFKAELLNILKYYSYFIKMSYNASLNIIIRRLVNIYILYVLLKKYRLVKYIYFLKLLNI